MNEHETPAEYEAAADAKHADHESQAFERSDAAKVAAVAALVESSESAARANAGLITIETTFAITSAIRKALADPDAALSRVRAEARAEALRDAMPTVNHSVQTEAQVLVDAAWKLRNDYPAGGSNVRAAIATLLERVAAAHDPATTTKYAGRPSRAEQIGARRKAATNE